MSWKKTVQNSSFDSSQNDTVKILAKDFDSEKQTQTGVKFRILFWDVILTFLCISLGDPSIERMTWMSEEWNMLFYLEPEF